MSLLSSILLGLIQGLAEFLPISSSGHLAIAEHFLGQAGVPATPDFFDVLLHLGTLVAVFAAYWQDIRDMIVELIDGVRDLVRGTTPNPIPPARRMILLIIVGTLPLFVVLPVKDLVAGMDHVPEKEAAIAAGLPYRDYMTLGVLVPKLNLKNKTKIKTVGDIVPDNWVYVHDRTVKLGRFQIYNNWSPYMVENLEHTVWVGLEYFVYENDEYWNMTEDEFAKFGIGEMVKMGLIDKAEDVIDYHMEKVKKAYPAYFDTYKDMDQLIAWLNTIGNLYCVGRNGQHRYNNIDHSMVTSFEAVKNILSGARDKSNIWSVNTEKEYHEEKK